MNHVAVKLRGSAAKVAIGNTIWHLSEARQRVQHKQKNLDPDTWHHIHMDY